MMKESKLTCIVCPKGCELTVTFDGEGKIEKITGHTCKRGEAYAQAECTAPVRTVTSTVRCEDGEVVAVKTATPIPKEKIFEVMDAINLVVAPNDAKIGDVVISNVCGTGSDVVITANR